MMALVTCKHCGADAASASRCPNCGGYTGMTAGKLVLFLVLFSVVFFGYLMLTGKL